MAAAQALTHALIFANGDLNDGAAVQLALAQPAFVIAADGGADLARQTGRQVQVVVGDMDSVLPETLTALEAAGVEILRSPAEKNETDLELALLEAAARGAHWIRIIGGVGNRLDQTLANVHLLSLPVLQDRDVRLVAHRQTIWLLEPGQHHLMGAEGDTLSLIPVAGDVTHISTQDMQYPLVDETLPFGPARGVSNVICGAEPQVQFASGILLVVHTIGRA